jgi:hypothetical protein
VEGVPNEEGLNPADGAKLVLLLPPNGAGEETELPKAEEEPNGPVGLFEVDDAPNEGVGDFPKTWVGAGAEDWANPNPRLEAGAGAEGAVGPPNEKPVLEGAEVEAALDPNANPPPPPKEGDADEVEEVGLEPNATDELFDPNPPPPPLVSDPNPVEGAEDVGWFDFWPKLNAGFVEVVVGGGENVDEEELCFPKARPDEPKEGAAGVVDVEELLEKWDFPNGLSETEEPKVDDRSFEESKALLDAVGAGGRSPEDLVEPKEKFEVLLVLGGVGAAWEPKDGVEAVLEPKPKVGFVETGLADENEGVAFCCADGTEEKEKVGAVVEGFEEGLSTLREESFLGADVPKERVVGGVLVSAGAGNELRLEGKNAIPFRFSSKLVFLTVGLGGGFFIENEGVLSNWKFAEFSLGGAPELVLSANGGVDEVGRVGSAFCGVWLDGNDEDDDAAPNENERVVAGTADCKVDVTEVVLLSLFWTCFCDWNWKAGVEGVGSEGWGCCCCGCWDGGGEEKVKLGELIWKLFSFNGEAGFGVSSFFDTAPESCQRKISRKHTFQKLLCGFQHLLTIRRNLCNQTILFSILFTLL